MGIFRSDADLRRGLLGLGLLCLLLVALYVGARQYVPFVFDARELRTWIDQFGRFAPLVFVLVQALQVIVAPIPGQIVALVAGYLFGPVQGTAYSLAGVLLGSAVAFSLAQRFGRPMVERLLDEDLVARFDGFVDRVGLPGLFVFVVIPGLPDDAICFLSGLTRWRLRTFIAVISVGRLPAYVVTVYAGGELASGQVTSALALLGAVVALSVVGYYKQDAIRNRIRRLSS
jgi:uncharacterized membrane protein YdjX (TVP38/TMEM64 family)